MANNTLANHYQSAKAGADHVQTERIPLRRTIWINQLILRRFFDLPAAHWINYSIHIIYYQPITQFSALCSSIRQATAVMWEHANRIHTKSDRNNIHTAIAKRHESSIEIWQIRISQQTTAPTNGIFYAFAVSLSVLLLLYAFRGWIGNRIFTHSMIVYICYAYRAFLWHNPSSRIWIAASF